MNDLGLIVGVNGIEIDPGRVWVAENWEAPGRLEEVHACLKCENLFWRLVRKYSRVLQLLTIVTRLVVLFQSGSDRTGAFNKLCAAFTFAVVLGQLWLRKRNNSGNLYFELHIQRSPIVASLWRSTPSHNSYLPETFAFRKDVWDSWTGAGSNSEETRTVESRMARFCTSE